MEEQILELMQRQRAEMELANLEAYNEKTEQYGVSLSQEEAHALVVARNESLKKYRRVEFGEGILEKVVFYFCDSQYLNQENYAETLMKLQDIFYKFKNESCDRLTDDELLNFMKEQFEEVCAGDTDYLADTCLERFSRAVRAGYKAHQESEGNGAYEAFSEEQRWDKDLYLQVVKELFWD